MDSSLCFRCVSVGSTTVFHDQISQQPNDAVLQGTTLPLASVACLLVCSLLLHGVMFAFNSMVVRLLRLGGADDSSRHIRRAVILCASQKTLPVAVTILHQLSGVLGGAVGLAVIPCVVSHMAQIVMDSMIVSQWVKQDAAVEAGVVQLEDIVRASAS